MSRLATLVFATLLCLGLQSRLLAQDATSDSPAHISVVDGAAVLERDGRTETAPASMPLLAGDRVRTQNGRVEILYADGSTLHLDTSTVVDFQSDEIVRLLDGRVRLTISGPRRPIDYRVDAPSAWVQVATPGEYRISVIASEREPEVELAVLRGAADLVNEDGRTSLSAGERAFARAGGAPSASYVYNSAAWDAFDRWSEGRRDARLGGAAAEYLPEEVQPYAATFSSYGYWQNVPTYGHVWYPRVRPGWRPYYYGYWSSFRPWGWTWIGSDPWAWPTHHYGRWGFSAGSWFWIPGRVWGPAWVSWAYAPSYVSWCPLGWNNRPVFAFNAGFSSGYYNPWNAWTVVPHRGFGRGFVNLNVVNVAHIDVRTRNSFVVRETAPDVRGYAVPRASAPIRVAGTRLTGVTTGTAGFSRSPTPGVAQSAPTAAAAAATLGSRRSPSTPLNASGYPAPAREPRDVSTIPSPSRQAAPRTRSGGVISSSPNVQTGPQSDLRSPVERRAVPRDERPAAAISSPNPMYSPSPSYGAARERSPYRGIPSAESPAQDRQDQPRAVPRSAPSGGVPDGYYRSRPGPEHSAPAPSSPPPSAAPRSAGPSSPPPSAAPRSAGPSGPPPSAAPPPQHAAPSGPPPAASGGGESRSRSGAPSSGHAMPRGGRGGR